MMLSSLIFNVLALTSAVSAQHYTATYLPDTAPAISEKGQTGTNKCGTQSSNTSMCQNAYLNSLDDFCVWAPPDSKGDTSIGSTERIEVSWCLKDGYGTRLIPPGTITGAHFVQTPDYAQITGFGDFTKINVRKNDAGGELDPHGADGNGNPIGGLVFGTSFGKLQQYHEWTSFMSATEFCFRVCKDAKNAPKYCQHIYDVMGCQWNMPGNYNDGFTSCAGDSTPPMGIYGASTFHQGDGNTPPPHPAGASSSCSTFPTLAVSTSPTPSSTPAPSGSAAASGSGSSGAVSPSPSHSAGSRTIISGQAILAWTISISLALGAATAIAF